MKFEEALNIISESSPERVAALLDNKCKNFHNDGSQIDSVINLIYNEIKLGKGRIPIGNNTFIDSTNKKQMEEYILNIKNNLKTKDQNILYSIDASFNKLLDTLF